VLRSNDPDLWRNVFFEDEDPNHFINFGASEYGKPPFVELPRERGTAVAKFGESTVRRLGFLPWRIEEMAGNLRRGFEGMGRRGLAASRPHLRRVGTGGASDAVCAAAASRSAPTPSTMTVHLLPIGRGRFDLYAEPIADDEAAPDADAGTARRLLHRAGVKWGQ